MKCFRSRNPYEKAIFKSFASSWGKSYAPTLNFKSRLTSFQMTVAMLQLNAAAVFGKHFFETTREMNYERWANFFLGLYLDDEAVFDWLIEEMITRRSVSGIDPRVARELADRHFKFVADHTFSDLEQAAKAVTTFGIKLPEDFKLEHTTRDRYAELLWTNRSDELEKQIEDNSYLLWVESCTHLPSYSSLRAAYSGDLKILEKIAESLVESLGHNVPISTVTERLEKVLDDLDVTWAHLINRVRGNGLFLFREEDSATTVKSVLARLLLAKEQSLVVQLMLWPSPKLQEQIADWRKRAKLDKEPVTYSANHVTQFDSSPARDIPRGYVARSWKNRWRRD